MRRADRELAEILNAFSSSSSTKVGNNSSSCEQSGVSNNKSSSSTTPNFKKNKTLNNQHIFDREKNKKYKKDYIDILNSWVDAENCSRAVDWISNKDLLNQLNTTNNSIKTGNKAKSLSSDLVVIEHFLPDDVAHGLFSYLNNLPKDEWLASSSAIDNEMENNDDRSNKRDNDKHATKIQNNYATGAGSTQHAFVATEGIVCINSSSTSPATATTTNSDNDIAAMLEEHKDDNVMDRFQRVLYAGILKNYNNHNHNKATSSSSNSSSNTNTIDPSKLSAVFQCAKYSSGHYIEPHDDVASEVLDNILYIRDTAIILYLSPEWNIENGGIFLDHSVYPVRPIVPRFNTLVAFKVPKLHEVSKIHSNCKKQRYSIFGWLLKPIKQTNMNNDDDVALNSHNSIGSNNNNDSYSKKRQKKRNQKKKKNKNKQKQNEHRSK